MLIKSLLIALNIFGSLVDQEKALLEKEQAKLANSAAYAHILEFEEDPQAIFHSIKESLNPGTAAIILVYPQEALFGGTAVTNWLEMTDSVRYWSSLSFKNYIEMIKVENFQEFSMSRAFLTLKCEDKESFKDDLRQWLPNPYLQELDLEEMADLCFNGTEYCFRTKVFIFRCLK